MSTADQVLSVLAQVAEVEQTQLNPDLKLYDLNILDSLKTVELIVAFSDHFGVEISPAEFEREQWATPARIVRFIESKLVQ